MNPIRILPTAIQAIGKPGFEGKSAISPELTQDPAWAFL
jgi:hypothetical protein